MKTMFLILLVSAGITMGTPEHIVEPASSVTENVLLDSTQDVSTSVCLQSPTNTEIARVVACKEEGESCTEHEECCKWPVWLSCVWGKCGTL